MTAIRFLVTLLLYLTPLLVLSVYALQAQRKIDDLTEDLRVEKAVSKMMAWCLGEAIRRGKTNAEIVAQIAGDVAGDQFSEIVQEIKATARRIEEEARSGGSAE